MACRETKDSLLKRLSTQEEELHEANNSVEYWSVSYHELLKEYNSLKDRQEGEGFILNTIDDEFKLEIVLKMFKNLRLEELQALYKLWRE